MLYYQYKVDARVCQTTLACVKLTKQPLPPYPLQTYSLEALLPLIGTSTIPKNITTAVRNNAGGAYNHLLFFEVCSAQCTRLPWAAQHLPEVFNVHPENSIPTATQSVKGVQQGCWHA